MKGVDKRHLNLADLGSVRGSTNSQSQKPPESNGSTKPSEVKNKIPKAQAENQTNPINTRRAKEVDANLYVNDVHSDSDSGIYMDEEYTNESISFDGSPLNWSLFKADEIAGESFDSRMLLSGKGRQQEEQVNELADALLEGLLFNTENSPQEALKQLLADVHDEKQDSDHDFFLRSAILLASEKVGAGIHSWQVYTHKKPEGVDQWTWLEKPSSWVPEAQAAAAKHTETAFIKALNLAKTHKEEQVIAYKGGFGAGKTSHGTEAFGYDENNAPLFKGSISPDAGKQLVRKTMPVSHNSAHVQGSNVSFNLFDGLISKKMGTIVYDSSLARSSDITGLISKSEAAQKSLKVVDIVRDDRARFLAVLARTVSGEDPRIPVSFLLSGASMDRAERCKCFNTVINSKESIVVDKIDKKEKTLSHVYEFHCANQAGSDRQLLFTLHSDGTPDWNITKNMSMTNIEERLTSQGISYDGTTNQFMLIDSKENWREVMKEELRKPVSELVAGLSNEEGKIRTKQFSSRTITFDRAMSEVSIEALYEALPLSMTSAISLEGLSESFSVLDNNDLDNTLKAFKECSQSPDGKGMSYMNIPTSLALEINRLLINRPDTWQDS